MQAATTPTTDNPGPLIWVLSHNEAARDAALLRDEAWRLQRLKPNKTRQALIDAIYSGFARLHNDSIRTAQNARDRGLLLFCWHGTKVLEGGAA